MSSFSARVFCYFACQKNPELVLPCKMGALEAFHRACCTIHVCFYVLSYIFFLKKKCYLFSLCKSYLSFKFQLKCELRGNTMEWKESLVQCRKSKGQVRLPSALWWWRTLCASDGWFAPKPKRETDYIKLSHRTDGRIKRNYKMQIFLLKKLVFL